MKTMKSLRPLLAAVIASILVGLVVTGCSKSKSRYAPPTAAVPTSQMTVAINVPSPTMAAGASQQLTSNVSNAPSGGTLVHDYNVVGVGNPIAIDNLATVTFQADANIVGSDRVYTVTDTVTHTADDGTQTVATSSAVTITVSMVPELVAPKPTFTGTAASLSTISLTANSPSGGDGNLTINWVYVGPPPPTSGAGMGTAFSAQTATTTDYGFSYLDSDAPVSFFYELRDGVGQVKTSPVVNTTATAHPSIVVPAPVASSSTVAGGGNFTLTSGTATGIIGATTSQKNQPGGPVASIATATSATSTVTVPAIFGGPFTAKFTETVTDALGRSATSTAVDIQFTDGGGAPSSLAITGVTANPNSPISGQTVNLSVAYTGSPTSFSWTGSVSITNATSQNASFVAPVVSVPTNYTIQILISDGASNATSSVLVTVNPAGNPPPVMSLVAMPASGTASLVVTLDGSASTDDGSIVSYLFTPNGGIAPITTTSSSVVVTYASTGSFTPSVQGMDNLSATASVNGNLVTVNAVGNNTPVLTLFSIAGVTSNTIAAGAPVSVVQNWTDADNDVVTGTANRLSGELGTFTLVGTSTVAPLTSTTHSLALTADPVFPLPKTITIEVVGNDGTVQVVSPPKILTVIRENRAQTFFGTVFSSTKELTAPNGTPGVLAAGPGSLHVLSVTSTGANTVLVKFAVDMGSLYNVNNEPAPTDTPQLFVVPYLSKSLVGSYNPGDAGRTSYWDGMPLVLEQPSHDYGNGQIRTCSITIRTDWGDHLVRIVKSGPQAVSGPHTYVADWEYNSGYIVVGTDAGVQVTVTQTPTQSVIITDQGPSYP